MINDQVRFDDITGKSVTVAYYWFRLPLGTEHVVSSIPGSVGYIYPMFIEPTITWVPSGFSGYI